MSIHVFNKNDPHDKNIIIVATKKAAERMENAQTSRTFLNQLTQDGYVIWKVHLVDSITIQNVNKAIFKIIVSVLFVVNGSSQIFQKIVLLNSTIVFHMPSAVSVAMYEPNMILRLLFEPIIQLYAIIRIKNTIINRSHVRFSFIIFFYFWSG